MKRQHALRWALGAGIAALAVAAPLPGAVAAGIPSRPNVVVLMTDDQTLESLRVMPRLAEQLTAQGTTFRNSFVSYPLCCPSRATFLTGQYAHNHGVRDNGPPDGGYAALDYTTTMPVALQRAGYFTSHIGKFLNGYGATDPKQIPAGWSEWQASVDPSTYNYFNYSLNQNGTVTKFGAADQDYQTDVYARLAADAIRRRAAAPEPFFLSVAFLAPHAGGPRTGKAKPGEIPKPVPAPRHRGRFAAEPLPTDVSFNEEDVSDKPAFIRNAGRFSAARVAEITASYRTRLESLLAVDEAVDTIVRVLEETGKLNSTVIFFTSDNGFFHGEHRRAAGKVLAYDPSTRVPLIVRAPGIPGGQVVTQPVANIDLAPTIFELTGATPLRTMDGRSLIPFLTDPGRKRLGRDLLIESGPFSDPKRRSYAAIRTPQYLYVEHSTGEKELYDVRRDPWQVDSRHADPAYASIMAELARRLANLRTCVGESCRRGPRIALSLIYRSGRYRGGRRLRCADSNVGARLVGEDTGLVSRVNFLVDGRLIARDDARPFGRIIPRRRMRTNQSKPPSLIRAYITLSDGRNITYDRVLRVCPPA
jgi:arylsulfatase A-like enzyme